MEIAQLSLFGNVQLTAQALRELAAREVPIVHLSYGGWLNAVTTPPPHKNIELRRRQFAPREKKRKRIEARQKKGAQFAQRPSQTPPQANHACNSLHRDSLREGSGVLPALSEATGKVYSV